MNVWQATNPNARDFRKDVIGNAYHKTKLTPQPNGDYVVRSADPAKGYTAFFVELTYDWGFKYPFKFTSEVSIIPTAMPYRWSEAAVRYKDTVGGTPKARQ